LEAVDSERIEPNELPEVGGSLRLRLERMIQGVRRQAQGVRGFSRSRFQVRGLRWKFLDTNAKEQIHNHFRRSNQSRRGSGSIRNSISVMMDRENARVVTIAFL